MDALSILKQVKVLLGLEEAPAEVTVELKEAKLKDGTIVYVDVLEVGGKVTIKTVAEDGTETETPAPAGEHILEDESTIVVDGSGIITEVKPKVELAAEEVVTLTIEEDVIALTERVANLEAGMAQILDLLTQSAEVETEMKTKLTAVETKLGETEIRLEEVAKTPGTSSIKIENQEEKPLSKAEQRIAAIDALNKKNK